MEDYDLAIVLLLLFILFIGLPVFVGCIVGALSSDPGMGIVAGVLILAIILWIWRV